MLKAFTLPPTPPLPPFLFFIHTNPSTTSDKVIKKKGPVLCPQLGGEGVGVGEVSIYNIYIVNLSDPSPTFVCKFSTYILIL